MRKEEQTGSAGRAPMTKGAATGDRSVRILHVEQIADDFRKQSADIELIRRRFKADGSVVHPAHPFVALRDSRSGFREDLIFHKIPRSCESG